MGPRGSIFRFTFLDYASADKSEFFFFLFFLFHFVDFLLRGCCFANAFIQCSRVTVISSAFAIVGSARRVWLGVVRLHAFKVGFIARSIHMTPEGFF